ncbi:hypothetical protein HUE46_05470 [Flavobacterium columnare]|uniref:hypothetical protein n=1 Tax=Flavobacterium columnare TaxID=996 RepID=UPI000981C293|nr:hypothetical protein [Flavobacterium columnare]MBF6656402.1 hypothetical protein [Flavobacterium columnare]OOB82976.1 hypothetical protein BZL53_08475 [Flavobacterium columnare]QOG89510.1 hypothetical protein HUE41_05470 [Flavobacterium columnare]QOG92169.1 hypothetical protein HUE42_05465 [Flavobacterium columnare]QOG94833.1 hypothetical protein HUE43_05470 [Flavobacterium columnare]
MKKYIFYPWAIILLFILNFSCKENDSITKQNRLSYKKENQNDTIVTESGIFLISPNNREIDSLKTVLGEDFYTIADDSNYYISEIESFLKEKIIFTKNSKINFKNENYLFEKKSSKYSWLIIKYELGNKPQIYSLVDFYSKLNSNNSASNSYINNIEKYLKDPNFFSESFDINGDGKEDKIFSNKPNTGSDLLIYFYENNEYKLKLKSTNFSQDGGNQVSKILKNQNGFSIITDFPQGTDSYTYEIKFKDNNFIIEKVVHQLESWQNNQSKKIEFFPSINLKKTTDEIFNELIKKEESVSN